MNQFTLPLAGGLLIGISAVLFLYLNGRITGISGLLWRGASSRHLNSLCFIFGLPIGSWAYHTFAGVSTPAANDNLLHAVIGGLLVGIGVKLGSGCTSGHGVCGIGRLSIRSITATLVFMLIGILTVTAMGVFL